MKKRLVICLLPIIALGLLTGCGDNSPTKGATYKWQIDNIKHENFTDLGHYIIDVDTHTNFDFEKALAYTNERYDKWASLPKASCTALATKTDKGDVIVGRNLDLITCHYPFYITHVNPVDGFKYKTINFTNDQGFEEGDQYEDLKKKDRIDDDYYNALPLLATDSFNEKGLYIQTNMRSFEEYMICSGTNPSCPNRICTMSLPYVVAASCATVQEAVDYISNDLNVFTLLNDSVASGWNLCFMVGDASGEYGLIEIARNEISYLPYERGQANYYITPKWNVMSKGQSGYGRLEFGLKRVNQVQNDDDMMNLIDKVTFGKQILDVEYATQDIDKDGEPGSIHFKDKDGNVGLDWRSDNTKFIPIDENDKYIDIFADNPTHPEAPQVLIYKAAFDRVKAGNPLPGDEELASKYLEYTLRADIYWASDDRNFKELQKGLIDYYNKTGYKQMLIDYINGNEKPLRDVGNVWTTALSISCNCTQKRLTARFWEQDNVVMTWQF